ncbi:MAG TPA: exodeoxyribonuclease V subunit gamma, partial [Spirochaetia bacterium]|nr:exodeoxyribonuclease V subunit gamma [Spirochaetia bacterium]
MNSIRGIRLYTSNRLEHLADRLCTVLGTPLSSPFREEVILVQSKGMERWLSMQAATRFGIWANARYPFPNSFIQELCSALLPGESESPGFQPDVLTWEIMKILPGLIYREEFSTLKHYLQGDAGGLRCHQLSSRIADLFDQYLVYRPRMVGDWEKGREVQWQAVLWREVVRDLGGSHRSSLRTRLIDSMDSGSFETDVLPERVSLFGISVLPPFYLEILAHLARHCQINLFLMNPSLHYWADILSDREIARRTVLDGRIVTADSQHMEKGNSLLASMGSRGREFFRMILDLGVEPEESFENPGESSLLSTLQSDVLNLRERPEQIPAVLAADDFSVQIHSCHSPMREVEILNDQILGFFQDDPSLGPEEILVMAPDIEVYAPFIHAVFGGGSRIRIPYNISDRRALKESGTVRAFLSLLTIPDSRFSVVYVLDLLEHEPIRSKLGLDDRQVSLIKKWVSRVRVSWGIDGNERRELGLPASEENTWQAGLSRLLLGYALSGENLYEGILPYRDLEGSDAALLGVFVSFMEDLFRFGRAFRGERSIGGWHTLLSEALNIFFMPPDGSWGSGPDLEDIRFVQSSLDSLQASEELTGFRSSVGLDTVHAYLRRRLEGTRTSFGYLSGGITFCSMLPMRSIPFKVICLLGMNDRAFPRMAQTVEFDLMARNPLPGDRSWRIDDRYLFLETLLSARAVFYVSFVGQSIMDNSPLPPSVLVSELMEYIDDSFRFED